MPATEQISLSITLPLRDPAGLQDLIARLYDPADELYGQYLNPDEFAARFSPTKADYQAVAAYAQSQGLAVTNTHPNRLILDVVGPARAVEQAFAVKLVRYRDARGRVFHAPTTEPQVPSFLSGRIAGVVGIENSELWRRHTTAKNHAIALTAEQLFYATPFQIGSGPNGGLAPSDIKTAYNLTSVASPGLGQTLGLFELDGFVSGDISKYESQFKITTKPTLKTVKVAGYNGSAGEGSDEVTLDIELQIAIANYATAIYVYEGPNSSTGLVDTYNKIASDNLAKSVSTSWGLPELENTASIIASEYSAFSEMATQGQSIFAASGDSGADDNGSSLSVDDPASQPYVVGAGGTTLAVNSNRTYKSETTWNDGSGDAGGGGISAIWPIPSWQVGLISVASLGSTTMRNVPDVALDADPNTGYAIYCSSVYLYLDGVIPGWNIFGGTSCSAPQWAAFTALVNQARAANHKATLGFANPALYSIATGSNYSSDFHDVTVGTNLFYPAVTGYDDATGWGSFNGVNLGAALAAH